MKSFVFGLLVAEFAGSRSCLGLMVVEVEELGAAKACLVGILLRDGVVAGYEKVVGIVEASREVSTGKDQKTVVEHQKMEAKDSMEHESVKRALMTL